MALKRDFRSFAEKKALDFRNELELKSFDFLCAFSLCKYLNIPILEPDKIVGLEPYHLSNLLGEGSNHWSAATIPVGGGSNIILHNINHTEMRQQSNIMHELAHIICKHETPVTYSLNNLPGNLRNFNEEQEAEAEWLGSCLQLPRQALLWALKNGLSINEISERFVASPSMVQYRINITGVKNQVRL